jgi:hypothetical protein
MIDSLESGRRTIAIGMRARQKSDARHQEKFDCDSRFRCIILKRGAGAEDANGACWRRFAASCGGHRVAHNADIASLGDKQKSRRLPRSRDATRASRARFAAGRELACKRRARPLRAAFARSAREGECVR